METPEETTSTFLDADEIDEPRLAAKSNESDTVSRITPAEVLGDVQDAIDPQINNDPSVEAIKKPVATSRPTRPMYKRETSVRPPQQPPPAPPQQVLDSSQQPDSLTMAQLKKIKTDMPKMDQAAYAFEYGDSSLFEEEIEEIFGYSVEERAYLLRTQLTFARQWQVWNGLKGEDTTAYEDGRLDWCTADRDEQEKFLQQVKKDLNKAEEADIASLEVLLYLALGCWHETAGLSQSLDVSPSSKKRHSSSPGSSVQIAAIRRNLRLIGKVVGVSPVFKAMRQACPKVVSIDVMEQSVPNGISHDSNDNERQAQWASITLLYLLVDNARRLEDVSDGALLRDDIVNLNPNLLLFLTKLLAEQRWDDSSGLPPTKFLLLYWKTILVVFGGTSHAEELKSVLNGKEQNSLNSDIRPTITASPLDYHLFRQEITSKYPAFDPPPPIFAFEPENGSILPPLQDYSHKPGLSHKMVSTAGPANMSVNGVSILDQPIHIATPVPSPPPSPAGPGGKGVKKQNYQTNQMFPFLYPPLEANSNDLGGKGSTELQDLFVGRKWHGSDIPASILEAADLFSKRMRATRAMKQLWEERVRFMRHERDYGIMEDLSLDDENNSGRMTEDSSESHLSQVQKQRLAAVEEFYGSALPLLQSMIIVFLKVLLQTVTTLVTQPNGLQNGFQSNNDQNGLLKPDGTQEKPNPETDKTNEALFYDIETSRSQEIMCKAISGIILLFLKWFKLSHILKFEYMTQLLLDSNFVQLVLKLFTHQELERIVSFRCERKNLNFLQFCQAHSRHGTLRKPEDFEGEDDYAAPPPIQRHRRDRSNTADDLSALPKAPPEVDELNFVTSEMPLSPITDYSWRNFFSSINHLRILQKIVKNKAHRQLLMVQYKYSNILKKWLRVPQSDVRLYTLKIIKGQVPYCHRKWRQSNMRIITAIYLHCRPELRDEWLAGVDVEAEMGDALALEQALRALTYWHNIRRYPEAMGQDKAKSEVMRTEQQDFFVKELEKMEAMADERSIGADASSATDEEMNDTGAAQRWENGSVFVEGW